LTDISEKRSGEARDTVRYKILPYVSEIRMWMLKEETKIECEPAKCFE